jgi:predicted membrane channel-forming protein YqfA (hemolysin III family)
MKACRSRKALFVRALRPVSRPFFPFTSNSFITCLSCNKILSDYLCVDMEAGYCSSKPRRALQHKLVHTNSSVHPKFHFCGSTIILCCILYISRCSSSSGNVIAASIALSANLFCFSTSTFCHYVLDSRKQLPSFFLLLDHIGIIMHIWGTSVSVLLLENTGSGTSTSSILGVTLAGVVCATYLIIWPREKGERVLVIGVFGALALCSVSFYNAVFSSMSRLTASFIFMALANGIGGWFYSRGSILVLIQSSSGAYTVSGHSLMHLCSLIASISHASILVSSVCK